MAKILSYVEKDTWIHRLSGVTKLVFFLLWCLTSMLTYRYKSAGRDGGLKPCDI